MTSDVAVYLHMYVSIYMFYEFQVGHSATDAAQNIRFVLESAVTFHGSRRWILKFRVGSFSLRDRTGKRRSTKISSAQTLAI